MGARTFVLATVLGLGAAGVAATPATSQAQPAAVPPAAGDRVTQPYLHDVTSVDGETWSTGGTYVSHGGKITLKLTTIPRRTKVSVGGCDVDDLSTAGVFRRGTPAKRVLLTDATPGSCFVLLFTGPDGAKPYRVKGTLSY